MKGKTKIGGTGNSGKIQEGDYFFDNKPSVSSGEKWLGEPFGHQPKRIEQIYPICSF